jgi:hypothetical protein
MRPGFGGCATVDEVSLGCREGTFSELRYPLASLKARAKIETPALLCVVAVGYWLTRRVSISLSCGEAHHSRIRGPFDKCWCRERLEATHHHRLARSGETYESFRL